MASNGQFCKGPVLHFVVFPQYNESQAYYLGTHVTSPKERQEQYEIPVFNDLGGRSARFQSVNDGEEWRIPTTLNRFDYNIVRAIRYLKSGIVFNGTPFPNPLAFPLSGLPIPLGTQSRLARGTLVMGQQDFTLILVNTYAGTLAVGLPTTAAIDLHTARSYASCSVTAYEEDQEATRVTEVSMMIEARGVFNPTLSAGIINSISATPPRGFAIYAEGAVPPGITLSPVN